MHLNRHRPDDRSTRRLAAGVIALLACIAAGADFATAARMVGASPTGSDAGAGHAAMSNFDYLVLASLADSQQPFSMAGYRSGPEQRTMTGYGATPNSRVSNRR